MAMFNVANYSSARNIKKNIEDKKQEINQLYGFIGMELYDMYKADKIRVPELNVHFEKVDMLEKTITEMEVEKQRLELQSKGNSICSCGGVISANNRFCPQCGKPVEIGGAICDCGNELKPDMLFCPQCGKNVKEQLEKTNVNTSGNVTYIECICGANVPEGQSMCMECGRKIEK